MELVQQLVSQLGIGQDQAKGGAGLLFKMAQEKLGGADFAKVAEAVPNVDDLINAAPAGEAGGAPEQAAEGGGLGGLLGGAAALAGKLGGSAGGLGSLASLAGGFSKLGLDTSMITKLIPVVLSFVQSRGGDGVKDLLAKALGQD